MMWWFTAVVAVLLVAQSTEGVSKFRVPLKDMSDVDVKELSSVIVYKFNKAAFTCPQPARTTLAFGLMTPKIPVSLPHVRQMVFGSKSTLPASVKDQIAQIVIDDVSATYIRPMEAMPEYIKLTEGLGDMGSKLDIFIHEVVKSADTAADVMTGHDVIVHMKYLIASVKAMDCSKMITIDQVKPFITKALAMLKIEGEITLDEKLIQTVKAKVEKIVTDKDLASKVMADVISVTKVIIRDMRDTVLAMVKVLPDELPVDIFLRNLVKFYHPLMKVTVRHDETAAKAAKDAIAFPTKKDACYEQKLSAYNTILLRLLSSMRVKKVGVLVLAHVKDASLHKPLFEAIKDTIHENYERQNLAEHVKPIMEEWWTLRSTMNDLKKAGNLNTKTIVEPVNKVLEVVGTKKICDVKQDTIVSVVAAALNSYKATIETDAVITFLKGKVPEQEMTEFKKVYEPLAAEIKVVFNAVLADFQANAFSVKPINAIVKVEVEQVGVKPVRQSRQVEFMQSGIPVESVMDAAAGMLKPYPKYAYSPVGGSAGALRKPWGMNVIENIAHGVEVNPAGVYKTGESMQHLLEVFGDIPIENLPTDIVMKTVIAITRSIQRQVPVHCRLPLHMKMIAALMRIHHGVIVAQPDRLMSVLTPVVQSINTDIPFTMDMAKTVIAAFTKQIRIASTTAAAQLGIYKGTEPVVMIMKSIIKEVVPGMTISGIYAKYIPRITALVNDAAICEDVSIANVVQEYSTYVERMLSSPVLSRPALARILTGIVPAGARDVVVNAIVTGALPLVRADVGDFVTTMTAALRNNQQFPAFYARLLVDVLPFNPIGVDSVGVDPMSVGVGSEFPFENVAVKAVQSPVYKQFLEELKIQLFAHLRPVSDLPVATFDKRLDEAYLTTLRRLGLQL